MTTPRHGLPFGCFTNTEKSSVEFEDDPFLSLVAADMDAWLLLEAAGLEEDEEQ